MKFYTKIGFAIELEYFLVILPDGAATIVEAEKLLLRVWLWGVGDSAVCGLGTLDHPSDPLPGPRGCWILTKTLEAGRRAGDQHCKEVIDYLTFDCSTRITSNMKCITYQSSVSQSLNPLAKGLLAILS